ncbi:MAG TPA: mitofilin family membrane protein [Rhodospirillales bacterium]|nr:mitofilin family membrane protein [Rhodospirillales bacterium]
MSKGPKSKAKPKPKAKPKTKPRTQAKTQVKAKAKVKAKAPPSRADSPKAAPSTPPPTPPPAPPEAVEATTATPRGSLASVSVVLFLTVIGIGTYMAWFYWSSLNEPNPPANKTASVSPPTAAPGAMEKMAAESKKLRQSLDRLMTRMETIEQSVEKAKRLAQATPPPSEKLNADPVLQTLTGRLNALEESGDTLKALTKRLDRMEMDNAAKAKALEEIDADQAATAKSGNAETSPGFETDSIATAKAVALAVADLRQAISSPAPFAGKLDALKALAGDDPDINAGIVVLAKGAETGIPTLVFLIDRFEGLAGKIVQASRTVKETGWFDRAANRLSSLVTWRRVDGKGEETSIDAMVAAAETHLKKGDLKAAINALDGLSGNAKAAAVATPWLSDAKARLAAERAVASLHLHALSMLTQIKPVKG